MATAAPNPGLSAKGAPKISLCLTILRGAAIVTSLGALIAAAYNISHLSSWSRYYGGDGPAGFIIFNVRALPTLSFLANLPRLSSHGSP